MLLGLIFKKKKTRVSIVAIFYSFFFLLSLLAEETSILQREYRGWYYAWCPRRHYHHIPYVIKNK